MAELDLDALTYPTMNVPPLKIQAPEEPPANGRNVYHWTVLGQHGFPMISVPAGFTTEVYDRVWDESAPGGTRLVGPVPARLPVGIDFAGRPFSEPLLIRIAAAFTAGTRHRTPPPEFSTLTAMLP
jgi:Asp-tRNA(Asn)/Glu-tRNA(Gln) amidotransferase A subunit family amidase